MVRLTGENGSPPPVLVWASTLDAKFCDKAWSCHLTIKNDQRIGALNGIWMELPTESHRPLEFQWDGRVPIGRLLPRHPSYGWCWDPGAKASSMPLSKAFQLVAAVVGHACFELNKIPGNQKLKWRWNGKMEQVWSGFFMVEATQNCVPSEMSGFVWTDTSNLWTLGRFRNRKPSFRNQPPSKKLTCRKMCSDGLKKTRLLYTFVLSHVSLFVEASSAGAPDIPRCPDHVGSQDRGQVRLLPIEARTPPLSSWVNLWSCELDDLPKHDLVGGWAYPSEKYEFVNGVGIIPYMKWKIKNVPNHQPVIVHS